MNIPVTLSINSEDIIVNATITLPEQYKHFPFEIVPTLSSSSALTLKCNTDLSVPTPQIENVYLMYSDGSNYKIGFSKTPIGRGKQLQTGNPHPLEVIACCPGGKPFEEQLQQKYDHRRITTSSSREWFDLTDEDVRDIKLIMAIKYFTHKFSESVALTDIPGVSPSPKKKISVEKKPLSQQVTKKPNHETTQPKKKSSHIVVDRDMVIQSIDVTKMINGKYKVAELKEFLEQLHIDISSNKILKENLQDLLLCFMNIRQFEEQQCTCKQLKNALICFDLSTSGLKQDLIDRLKECLLPVT